ncbi:hypothetical protein DM01DRAFT_1187436 [Hesseltinella vesiculosa]|uniref:Uncharacterized protein n=1 Tax=Hesseltinella vesiculosa TaxID=101127 RepID=A0A1X2GSE2_9FUNG|nr:hypothetical protein DM01DRAFT_1187436 [Hesseltinella vesiculosa]
MRVGFAPRATHREQYTENIMTPRQDIATPRAIHQKHQDTKSTHPTHREQYTENIMTPRQDIATPRAIHQKHHDTKTRHRNTENNTPQHQK